MKHTQQMKHLWEVSGLFHLLKKFHLLVKNVSFVGFPNLSSMVKTTLRTRNLLRIWKTCHSHFFPREHRITLTRLNSGDACLSWQVSLQDRHWCPCGVPARKRGRLFDDGNNWHVIKREISVLLVAIASAAAFRLALVCSSGLRASQVHGKSPVAGMRWVGL